MGSIYAYSRQLFTTQHLRRQCTAELQESVQEGHSTVLNSAAFSASLHPLNVEVQTSFRPASGHVTVMTIIRVVARVAGLFHGVGQNTQF